MPRPGRLLTAIAATLVAAPLVAGHAAHSITGGFDYRGSRFADLLGGHYVAGDFGCGRVFHHDGVQTVTAGRLPGVTSFGENGNDEHWAVTYDGGLYRMGASA